MAVDVCKPKLTIELVPSTSWYSNVRSEVSVSEWDFLRRMVYRKAGYRCEICGGKGKQWPVECHEVWKYDDERFFQTLVKMIALCPLCHKVKHFGLSSLRGEEDIAKKHLARVNGWSVARTEKYIDESFEKWQKRCCYEWLVDISILDEIFEGEVIVYGSKGDR